MTKGQLSGQDTAHQCPGPGCQVRIDRDRLACRDHWYQVSKPVRDEVWRLWREAPRSPAHLAALHQALADLGAL